MYVVQQNIIKIGVFFHLVGFGYFSFLRFGKFNTYTSWTVLAECVYGARILPKDVH